jgi:hypothetical protein
MLTTCSSFFFFYPLLCTFLCFFHCFAPSLLALFLLSSLLRFVSVSSKSLRVTLRNGTIDSILRFYVHRRTSWGVEKGKKRLKAARPAVRPSQNSRKAVSGVARP